MTVDSLRSLLYPLGFVANFLFSIRFFIQWIDSEKQKKSVVSRGFWRISWFANGLMSLHGLIQLQYPICLIQGLNTCIAWRNLNLMKERSASLARVLWIMVFSSLALTVLFILQGTGDWMRSPSLLWREKYSTDLSLSWHIAGFFGMALFASRYWFQWWFAEKHRKSFVGKSFWKISCIGALFSLAYAIRLYDPVNIIGFSVGLIPYMRNLMLSKKHQKISTPSSNALFIFAGEQSGDVLGAKLIEAIKQRAPEIHLYGVGGPEMRHSGMEIVKPMENFQVMGFSDVIKALPSLYKDFKAIRSEILLKNPMGVVFIDYPDFNMRLARSLRIHGYQGSLVHYVCPSVWAWRKSRIFSLANTLDQLLSILPFEKKYFCKTKLPVTYVGHPLVAAIDQYHYDPSFTFQAPLIAIFPGSRHHEIEQNLPTQLAVAKKMTPKYQIAISVARPQLKELIQKYADSTVLLVEAEKRYELMKQATAALATSGTITLELGLHEVPTIVTYRLAKLNYLLGRYIFRIRLPFYTLVNIICGKEVYPEFIHKELSEMAIYQALSRLIETKEVCQKECRELRNLLQTHDASQKAALAIINPTINRTN